MKEIFIRTDGKQDYCSYAPDVLFNVDLDSCCKAHDDNYFLDDADIQLRADLKTKFVEAGKPFKGWLVSNIYYWAVVYFRKLFYN